MTYPILRFCKYGHERTPENTRISVRVVNGSVVSARVCKACQRTRVRKWESRNPQIVKQYDRAKALRTKYGMTVDDFDTLFDAQDRKCAACESPTPGGRGSWHVDHDHDTGKVRAILCFKCNVAMGTVNDDIERLRLLVKYLERFQ